MRRLVQPAFSRVPAPRPHFWTKGGRQPAPLPRPDFFPPQTGTGQPGGRSWQGHEAVRRGGLFQGDAMKGPHGNGDSGLEIGQADLGGWVRVYPARTTGLPADLPVYLAQTL